MQITHSKVRTIAEAFTYFFLEKHWEFFEDQEIKHLVNTIDLDRLSDKAIVDNTYIRDQVDWDDVPRSKLIRCASRLIDNKEVDYVIDVLRLPERNLKISEIMHLIRRDPSIIDTLGINLDEATQQEAHNILLLGIEYFLDKIDIGKYNFDYHQAFNISKTYSFRMDVLKLLPYHRFNNLQVSQVIAYGGQQYAELFKIDKLKPVDWIYILERRPELYDLLDPLLFFEGDVYELVRLMELFDHEELHVMMKHRLKELTPYGMERLLIFHYGYKSQVNLEILDANNVAKIQEYHPDFQLERK